MPTSTTIDETKAPKSVPVNTTGHEKLEIAVMPSVSADGKGLMPYIIPKRKILPNEKHSLWNLQRTHSQMAERRLGQNTNCPSEKSGILIFKFFKGHYGEKVT